MRERISSHTTNDLHPDKNGVTSTDIDFPKLPTQFELKVLPTQTQIKGYIAATWIEFWESKQMPRDKQKRNEKIRTFLRAVQQHSTEGEELIQELRAPDETGKSPLARIPDETRRGFRRAQRIQQANAQGEKKKASKGKARNRRRKLAQERRSIPPKRIH